VCVYTYIQVTPAGRRGMCHDKISGGYVYLYIFIYTHTYTYIQVTPARLRGMCHDKISGGYLVNPLESQTDVATVSKRLKSVQVHMYVYIYI